MTSLVANNGGTAIALPALVTPSSPTHSRRGHMRSSSLENANAFISKNTLGLPLPPSGLLGSTTPSATAGGAAMLGVGHCGTLKSRNEQKRMRNKFGSHSNLDDYVAPAATGGGGRVSKFQNIRQMFEFSRGIKSGNSNNSNASSSSAIAPAAERAEAELQSLPPSLGGADAATATRCTPQSCHQRVPLPQQQHMHNAYQQQYAATQQQQQQRQQSPMRKQKPPTPTSVIGVACGHRSSLAELNERLNIVECLEGAGAVGVPHTGAGQQACGQQLLLTRKHAQAAQPQQPTAAQQQHYLQQQQQQQQQHQSLQQQQRSASGLAHLQREADSADQTTNLPRPIAFKPIPFEPDYSIAAQRYCIDNNVMGAVVDRYGSTPSLAPATGSTLRFGSTTDLRHGGGVAGLTTVGVGASNGGVGGGYSSNNYCNSLMAARRRGGGGSGSSGGGGGVIGGSRSLKINDSLESIRRSTPDSDANSQCGIKSKHHTNNHQPQQQHLSAGNALLGNHNNNGNNKYLVLNTHSHNNMSGVGGALEPQCDAMMTTSTSPSDSGISDLEAALKDRDSELSYLRQTMEHNEKDKETFWENETKRLKTFYDGQQRDYALKVKKLEQMLAMQQFQFKQHKMKHTEHANKLREQLADLKNDNEILRSNNGSLKSSERNLKDRLAYIEEQLRETQNLVSTLKGQLEECEWKVCERNGELALLKSQLKEANVELTMKEHALVHLKHENNNNETQIYQSIQQDQQQQQQRQVESQRVADTELRQLNKIVILKDQVILALTNELAKLRKELSDLAIFHEYGEEPSGKYVRLKQQLENLTDICNKTRRHAQKALSEAHAESKENVVDESNLEVIMNCLKLAPTLEELNDDEVDSVLEQKQSSEQRLAKMSADIQNFIYGAQNLPDVAMQPLKYLAPTQQMEESTLDTLIEESATYAEEIGKLRQQLDDVRVNFELEKRQWCEEKEKVLSYQKQLQVHYINMYQKLRNLESGNTAAEEV